jgi:transcriptional regulator with XRE-family HTH domain
MMITDQRRRELAEFLRTQRGRISPEKLGLRSTTRRRVEGLRRDEVAELADISVTWYTWLEQGRDINVSAQALDRIATALQCGDDERSYLFELAGEYPPQPGPKAVAPPANLQLLLDALDPDPAYVIGPRFDVIAWNASAADVFGDFGRYPDGLRNLLWILLTEPSMQDLFVEWERFVRCLLAWFRRAYSKAPDEPKWTGLVMALERASPHFRAWWKLHEVATPPDWRKELRHVSGPMALDPITLLVNSGSDLTIIAFTPARETDTEARLENLAKVRMANGTGRKNVAGGYALWTKGSHSSAEARLTKPR